MIAKNMKMLMIFFLAVFLILPVNKALAEEPIVIGAPLSTSFLYGWDAWRAMQLAVKEINEAGGVNVGGTKRPFKIEIIDTRDLEPGVPVSEALLEDFDFNHRCVDTSIPQTGCQRI